MFVHTLQLLIWKPRSFFPSLKNIFLAQVYKYTMCWGGNQHFIVLLQRSTPVKIMSRDGKDATCEGGKGRMFISRLSWYFYFDM